MARTKWYLYTVEGTFTFPIDMLRYDRAWPATSQDAALIQDTFEPGHRAGRFKVVVHGLSPPTTARWESFVWRVLEVETRYL